MVGQRRGMLDYLKKNRYRKIQSYRSEIRLKKIILHRGMELSIPYLHKKKKILHAFTGIFNSRPLKRGYLRMCFFQ